jgi:predicted GTPase
MLGITLMRPLITRVNKVDKSLYVRYWHLADTPQRPINVRFRG